MSAALLEQDFGSESEDDNFNPAVADDSGGEEKNDEKSEDDAKVNHQSKANGLKEEDRDNKDPEEKMAKARPFKAQSPGEDEEAEDLINGGGEDEDDDEEDLDEEDDDEEEVVSVRLANFSCKGCTCSTTATGSATEEGSPRTQKPVS